MADNQTAINENYPLTTYRYKVQVDGEDMNCSEVSGLTIEYDTINYKEATAGGIKNYQLLGQAMLPSISIKRGLFNSESELHNWLRTVHTNEFTKKDLTISLLDNSDEAIMSWKVLGAFPTKFEGPSLNAEENSIAFQSLDLNASTIQVEKVG